MSTVNGLPAHVLLVHFIVVLAPLTSLLAILCALWRPARERLVWLVLCLALVTAVLTPLTAEAGEWLEHRVDRTPVLEHHAELGETMVYFSLALLVGAVLLAVVHVRQSRNRAISTALSAVVAAFVVAASVATIAQTYRIGDSGAEAAWGDLTSSSATTAGDD